MNSAIIPGGTNTASPYEYSGGVATVDRCRQSARNDTLVWLEEQKRNQHAWRSLDPKNRS